MVRATEAYQEQGRLRVQHEAARFQFITTELDLAVTFCRIALSSDDSAKYERNYEYASQAYDVANRFLEGSNLTESKEIQRKLAGLRALLEQLGEEHRP
jgi:hypothetical protein